MNDTPNDRSPSVSLNHFNDHGDAQMVDVSAKPVTARRAVAVADITLNAEASGAVRRGDGRKGDVLSVARVAAVMAVKRTAELIPLCHPLPIDGVDVAFEWIAEGRLRCRVSVATTGRTGVEMEAITGASMATLAVYDMIKAVDRAAVIGPIRVEHKSGGPRERSTFAKPNPPFHLSVTRGPRPAFGEHLDNRWMAIDQREMEPREKVSRPLPFTRLGRLRQENDASSFLGLRADTPMSLQTLAPMVSGTKTCGTMVELGSPPPRPAVNFKTKPMKATIAAVFAPVAADLAEVDRRISKQLQSRYEDLAPVLAHGSQLGGKRMRPALVMLGWTSDWRTAGR